ncbi:MAG: hypothetical protein HPY50_01650 [Firmicutes bacterium]|nr:hypothetical protein [Bacillota bacterium]
MSQIYHQELAEVFLDSLKTTAKSFGELFVASLYSIKDVMTEWADRGGLTTLVVVLTALFFIVWALM